MRSAHISAGEVPLLFLVLEKHFSSSLPRSVNEKPEYFCFTTDNINTKRLFPQCLVVHPNVQHLSDFRTQMPTPPSWLLGFPDFQRYGAFGYWIWKRFVSTSFCLFVSQLPSRVLRMKEPTSDARVITSDCDQTRRLAPRPGHSLPSILHLSLLHPSSNYS